MTPSEIFRARWRNRSRKAMISVHRGLWGPAPENSFSAIEGAAPLGIIEIDVQLAGDGVPVVMHDDTLDRTTGRPDKVAETASEDIARLQLRAGGGGPESELTEERVPLFQDILSGAPDGSFFDFDIKHPREIEAVAAFLARHGGQHRGSLKIDTVNDADIARLLDLEARHGLMVMAKVDLPEAGLNHVDALTRAGVSAAEVWFDDPNQLAQACRIAGDRMAISTYTLDPVHCCGLSDSRALEDPGAVWGRLVEAGVSVIMSDRARQLGSFLDTL